MVIWYTYPILVCCTEKNLAALSAIIFFRSFFLRNFKILMFRETEELQLVGTTMYPLKMFSLPGSPDFSWRKIYQTSTKIPDGSKMFQNSNKNTK
jgi:hypothetical protein